MITPLASLAIADPHDFNLLSLLTSTGVYCWPHCHSYYNYNDLCTIILYAYNASNQCLIGIRRKSKIMIKGTVYIHQVLLKFCTHQHACSKRKTGSICTCAHVHYYIKKTTIAY